jgi:hypothetical protein
MIALPALILLGVTVALGLYLGLQFLRKQPMRPGMIGLHFLLGAGGLEVMVMLLRGAPSGRLAVPGSLGNSAAAFLAMALIAGVTAPMIGRRSRRTAAIALATHASLALGGFLLFLAWVVQL